MSPRRQSPTAGSSTGADVPMRSATRTPANVGGGAGTSQSAPAASTPIPIDAPTHNSRTEPVQQLAPRNSNGNGNGNGNGGHVASSASSSSHGARSPTGTATYPSLASRLAAQDQLIQLTDVQSGWIHLQSTYLDTAGGARRVRPFGLRNVSATPVDVEVASDLGMQVVFWADDETADAANEPPEKDSASADSASSTSLSTSSSPGAPVVNLCIPPGDTATVFLAFQPSTSQPSTPGVATPDSDGGFTPRVAPTTSASELSPVPGTRLPSAATAAHGTSILSDPGSSLSASTSVSASGTSLSGGAVSGSSRDRDAAAPTRRSDLVHRSFSVHGSVVVHATAHTALPNDVLTAPRHQNVTLPFFASVCRSLFSAAVIDPATGLVSGSQISSGELVIDFGTDNAVGTEVHRDILIVNRSEIDLVWNTAVLNCRFKDSVWFSLRDLDSENVFGVDTSAEPVPLPALSSRHLRLALRATSPITDFDFDFVISNMNQSGNVVTCRAVGSCQSTTSGDTLRILSGSALDFGQIPDGTWAKKLLVAKNVGDRPIDVHFSATPGYEVVFRLAGVAGEDIDEDVPARTPAPHKRAEALSRTSTRDGSVRGRDASFGSRYSDSGFGNRLEVVSSGTVASAQRSQPTLSEAGSAIETEELLSGPASTSDRDSSMPPSRPLSRVTSRSSSYRPSQNDGDSDDDREPMLLTGATDQPQSQAERPSDNLGDRDIPNQIEELTMRPGTEYRVFAMYRPARDLTNAPEVAGALRPSTFKVYLDSAPSAQRSRPVSRSRKAVHCTAESCTSIIAIPTGHLIDFGEVTVGASKSTTIEIQNLSALSARVEIAAISKVLNTNRNVIVIPPYETVNERIDFFPRRINDRYEKQVFVRNHLNRTNNQLIEVHSKNVDVYNVTLHSHLYRILTPSGRNFVDFGSVVVNSPSVRTVQFQNLTHKPLTLDLSASQPEDVDMYIKESDAPPACPTRPLVSKYPPIDEMRTERPTNGSMKERFVESLQEKDQGSESKPPAKHKSRDKSVTRRAKDEDKASLGASLVAAIKRGGRGRPVQLYRNAVVFKDRSLLDSNEYLDLASGPPIAAHRGTVHSKRIHVLETIAQEDKSLLSGQHPKVLKLDFAASAKSNGLMSKELRDGKLKKMKSTRRADRDHPTTPVKGNGVPRVEPPSPTQTQTPITKGSQLLKSGSIKSPALTGKRAELKMDPTTVNDVTKLTPDELILALEDHDARRSQSAVTHFSPEEEEQYVRRLISLRKELQNAISSGKFVHARTLTVPPGSSRQLVVVMTPNGSTRPHITTRAKRSESRIYIKLLEYDQSLLSKAVGPHRDLSELPVRDLVIRSSCVRSVLEVQQSSINFGTCERGEVKSRTIVIHNKSDCPGVFRMRTSGSIASGNLKLGLGRYGVVSAFGRKEVASFSFIPSMVGNFQETIVVENVLDSFNDQNVLVKATVRKMPAFSLDVTKLDIAPSTAGAWPSAAGFVLTNTSKTERTFIIEAAETANTAFAELSLSRDEKDAGQALSKGEEEEVEAILQKLKIARRKNKPDKIAKYEKRLGELGVVTAPPEDAAASAATTPVPSPPLDDAAVSGTVTPGEVASSPTIAVTLQASKKAKILVNLVSRDGKEAFSSTIKVFERKNTDETVTIDVTASPEPEAVSPAPTPVPEDPLNLAIMRHCLELTLECPVSPTAFCVGSTLFLPASSRLFPTLRSRFPVFSHPVTGKAAGLVLADGYSRQIPGNTHAEANALANFRERMVELEEAEEERAKADTSVGADVGSPSPSPGPLASSSAPLAPVDPPLPTPEVILAQAVCFATMEPCSVRTSGGPSCALELVRAHVHAVYLGVEEPPDFVQCEGVRILEQGGVEVRRVVGLEDECLRAARRGRN